MTEIEDTSMVSGWTAEGVYALVRGKLPSVLRRLHGPLLTILGVKQAILILQRLEGSYGFGFVGAALQEMEVTYNVALPDGVAVPNRGPLLVVANHHLGGIDSLVLLHYLLSVRPDVAVIANRFLTILQPIRDVIIPAFPLSSMKPNPQALLQARRHLQTGGCLLIFPSGRVASFSGRLKIRDTPWQLGTGALARLPNVVTLPVAVRSSNSALFYAVRTLSLHAGSVLLLRELLRARGKHISLVAARPIPATSFDGLSIKEIVTRLRTITYYLVDNGAAAPPSGGANA